MQKPGHIQIYALDSTINHSRTLLFTLEYYFSKILISNCSSYGGIQSADKAKKCFFFGGEVPSRAHQDNTSEICLQDGAIKPDAFHDGYKNVLKQKNFSSHAAKEKKPASTGKQYNFLSTYNKARSYSKQLFVSDNVLKMIFLVWHLSFHCKPLLHFKAYKWTPVVGL